MGRSMIDFVEGITFEIRRGGNNPRKKATGLSPVALIDLLAVIALPSEFGK